MFLVKAGKILNIFIEFLIIIKGTFCTIIIIYILYWNSEGWIHFSKVGRIDNNINRMRVGFILVKSVE